MPDGVARLAAFGVEVAALDSAPLAGIRYLDGELRAEALFDRHPGRGIRRPVLHRALIDRAAAIGVRMEWGTTVKSLADGRRQPMAVRSRADESPWVVDSSRGRIQAHWVIGADGLHSRVRRWMGLESRRCRWRRFGVRRHYAVSPWTDRVEVHWIDRAEAYVTPVSNREVGIAFLWSGEKGGFDFWLERFPALAARLQGVRPTSTDRGAAQLEQRARATHRGRVALVGDAAGYRDAITGEGLSLAFHQAAALAAAIHAGDLATYGRDVARLTRLPFLLIRLLLEAEHRPWLRRRLIRALAADPALFAKLVAIHTRDAPPHEIGPAGVLRLARGLLG